MVSDIPLLELREVKKHYPVRGGLLGTRTVGAVRAVDGVSFRIGAAETLSIVGESGCGKTTTARLVLRLETPTAGTVAFQGTPLERLDAAGSKIYRSSVQAVFQDPWSSLNPRLRAGAIIAEPLVVNTSLSPAEVRERVADLLVQVGLRPEQAQLYPHQFSGGQRQRVAIARALSIDPRLIVLDEPVSALDVSIRAQILNLLKDLQERLGLSYVLIAHHLATVRHMSHQVAVMYLGQIVELAPGRELFAHPLHPYTQALLSAIPLPDPRRERERRRIVLQGDLPSPADPPAGCRFHTRCPYVQPTRCRDEEPALRTLFQGHTVACHFAERIRSGELHAQRRPPVFEPGPSEPELVPPPV